MLDKFKETKVVVVLIIILMAASYGMGRYLQPAKVEIKKEEIIKEVEVIKKDIEIIEREIKRPDGTIEKERIERDKSTETVNKDSKTKESTLIVNKKPDWNIQALAAINKDRDTVYGLKADRRILGNIYIGGFGLTDSTVGLSIGMEF